VVVKWFAAERGFEKALKLRDMHLIGLARLVAPNLILYEVANALRFHRIYRFSAGHIVESIKSLVDLGMAGEPDPEIWRTAVELSYRTGVSVYDAIYAALAITRKALLVTSDEELYNRLKSEVSVVLLREVE
jgi:predicted nucleic acid-binding protein